jgi:hypothetical protein
MKPLSLEEISMVQEYEDWSDFDMNDNFERLLHTAREYHRLREALKEIANSYAWSEPGCPFRLAREALKESEGE